MKKLFKFIAYLIGAVVVLLVAAAVAIPAFFDPNDYRDEVVAKVKSETGRDLTIDGDIGLTLFPWVGAEVGTVEVGNAPGFADPYFARVEKVSVRVKLMPLLSRQVEMDTVTVHGLSLNLARDEQGKSNWADLAGGGSASSESGGGEQGSAPQLAGLAIGGLDIKNASLKWNDAQSGQTFAVDRLDLETGALTPGQPVSLNLAASLSGSSLPADKAELSLSGNVSANPATGAATVDDLVLEVDITGGAGPAEQAKVSLRGNVSANPATGAATVDGLVFEADITGGAVPGGQAKVSLTGNLQADPAAGTYTISDLELGAMDLQAAGRLEVRGETIAGNLDVSEFDLKKLLASLGQAAPVTADPDALGKVAFSTTVSGTTKAVELAPISVKLDDSTLEGTLGLARFDAPMPAVRFDLALDAIDADRYLPPPSADQPAPATPGTAAAGGAGLPMETLRALDVDGAMKVGQLKAGGLSTSDVSVVVKAKDGVIALSPVAAKLYEGTYAGNVRLDARGSVAKISADEKLSGLQIAPLLKDAAGSDRLSGTTEATIKVTASGADADSIKKTLNGDVGFAFTEGALNGINVARTIREFKAKLKGQSLPPTEETLKTDFSRITGTFQIVDGIATNKDLEAMSPLLRVLGQGTIDLTADQLDYRPTVTLVATTKGEGGKDLEDLVGVPIPLRVHGPLAAPQYGVDFDKAVEVVAKSKAEDLIKDKLGDKLPTDKLGGALPGAIGGLLSGGTDDAKAEEGSAPTEPAGDAKAPNPKEALGEAVKGLKGLFGN